MFIDMPSQSDIPTASSTTTSSPPKHTKLRESCDSCLIAKVKCSKTRPLCARCLSNGAPCGYSPSSRAGRKNRNAGIKKAAANSTAPKDTTEQPQSALPTSTLFLPSYMCQIPESNVDNTSGMWGSSSPVTSKDQRGSQLAIEKGLIAAKEGDGYDTLDFLPTPPLNGDFMDSFMPLPSHNGFAEFSTATPSLERNGDQAPVSPAWTINSNQYSFLPSFQSPLDMMPLGHVHSSHPATRPALPTQHEPNQSLAQTGSSSDCDCFASCLHALQSLHNHSWMSSSSTQQGGVPFDIVLTINREAIDGCSALLGCDKCVSKVGSSITTMLLATIFGKVMSLYRATCMFRFGSSTGAQASAQLAFGAYTVTGEDRQILEIEILLLELRKVENILILYQERFHNSQAEQDESSVYTALTSYLDKNLRYIVDFLQVRKGETSK